MANQSQEVNCLVGLSKLYTARFKYMSDGVQDFVVSVDRIVEAAQGFSDGVEQFRQVARSRREDGESEKAEQ